MYKGCLLNPSKHISLFICCHQVSLCKLLPLYGIFWKIKFKSSFLLFLREAGSSHLINNGNSNRKRLKPRECLSGKQVFVMSQGEGTKMLKNVLGAAQSFCHKTGELGEYQTESIKYIVEGGRKTPLVQNWSSSFQGMWGESGSEK